MNRTEPYPREETIKKLRESINDTTKYLQAASAAYYIMWIFFVSTILEIKEVQLLVGKTIEIPPFDIHMSTENFFKFSPVFMAVIHTYVLVHISFMAYSYSYFHEETHVLTQRDKYIERQLLFPSLLNIAALGPKNAGIMRGLVVLMIGVSLIVLPIFSLVFCQIKFLPFHSNYITGWHQNVVRYDALMIAAVSAWFLWKISPIAASDAGRSVKSVLLSYILPGFYIALILGSSLWLSSLATVPNIDDPNDRNRLDSIRTNGWRNLVLPAGLNVKAAAGNEVEIDLSDRDLRRAHLDKVDFSGMKLIKADFQQAQLSGTDFTNASLVEANFNDAVLNSAQFNGANLTRASFVAANAENARFIGAQLHGTNFGFTYLPNADFTAADISGRFLGAFVDHAQFVGALTAFPNFTGASLRDTDFHGASIAFQIEPKFEKDVPPPKRIPMPVGPGKFEPDLSFAKTDLTGARFDGVDMEIAGFSFAELAGVEIGVLSATKMNEAVERVESYIPDGKSRRMAMKRLEFSASHVKPILPVDMLKAIKDGGDSVGKRDAWQSLGVDFATVFCGNPPTYSRFMQGAALSKENDALTERLKVIAGSAASAAAKLAKDDAPKHSKSPRCNLNDKQIEELARLAQ